MASAAASGATGHPADRRAGLTLVRREAANSSERCFEKPLASILVQGNKHTVIGTHAFSIAAKTMSGFRRGHAQHVICC